MAIRSTEKSSYNFFRVLRSIWQHEGISRTELGHIHGLDKATVSTIVSELVDIGVVMVADVDTTAAGPGRRREILQINERWGYVAGIELRPDGVTSCAADLHGRIIASHRHHQRVERATLRETFFNCLESLKADDRVVDMPLLGVGVGLGGIVRREDAVIVHSIPLDIHEPFDFQSEIGRRLTVPLVIDNDANCAAWSEILLDRESPKNSLFVLLEFRNGPETLLYGGGVGLGLGFVLNGSVYYGEDESAGEFRSIYWHPGYSSQFGFTNEEAIDVANKPDSLDHLIRELAQHIALFVNTLNLKKVYIGGDAAEIGDSIVEAIQRAIRANWPYDEPIGCAIQIASTKSDTAAVGAAAMILERLFEEPLLPAGLKDRNHVWSQILRGRKAPVSSKR
ncbi:MAG: ROK family transcriptional regulator [Spirochaetota bacterium]